MTYIIIGIFVIAIGYFIYSAIKRREEVFEGEVIDKDVVENQVMNNDAMNRPGTISIGNSGVQHTYKIKVKTDAGKVINYTVSEGKYEIIKIGDRVSKAKGTTEITVISSKQTTNTPVNNPTPPTINPGSSPTPLV